jgi:hypothetical protein
MALAIDASSPAHASATSGAPATTASFTPPTGALLVAMTAGQTPSAGDDMSITVTGGGLTWTRRVARIGNDAANSTGGVAGRPGTSAEVWTAVSAGASMTVAADQDNGNTAASYITRLQVQVVTDGGSTPVIGSVGHAISASGAPSCTIASVAAGSYIFGCVGDWSSSGAGTAQTGETMLTTGDDADWSWHFLRSTSTTSAGSYTFGVSSPATQDYNIVALEVQSGFVVDNTTKPALPGIFIPELVERMWF